MKKYTFLSLLLLLLTVYSNAQTKVFKEVNEGISSQVRAIMQDGALMGYLAFTQLEKASADSFNYKITIMDENLNDIGVLNFREQRLDFRSVSIEQDVLCLAYLKSNFIGYDFNRKDRKQNMPNGYVALFTQFISLNGKILTSNTDKLNITMSLQGNDGNGTMFSYGTTSYNKLKTSLELSNITRKGFVCFYTDEKGSFFSVFSTDGDMMWRKKVQPAESYALLTSFHNIYILSKKDWRTDGGFELSSYRATDSTFLNVYPLKDKKGNELKVTAFDNDPVTQKPYITGNIINKKRSTYLVAPHNIKKGCYAGVFTLNINGTNTNTIEGVYSYWDDNSKAPDINRTGKFAVNKSYAYVGTSFKDYNGNTYFGASVLNMKTRWGAIGASVVTLPTILIPVFLLGNGIHKYRITDAMVFKQNDKGALSFEAIIPSVRQAKPLTGKNIMAQYETKSFYNVANSDTKSNYMIINDRRDVMIYNVNQKKIIRTIPHKDGNIITYIYPAKEGHVMVSEYNRKEHSTRYSIEAL